MPTKITQIVRKKDGKARTFDLKDFKKDSFPKHNEKSNRFKNLEEEYQNITEEKYILIQIKYQILKKIV